MRILYILSYVQGFKFQVPEDVTTLYDNIH